MTRSPLRRRDLLRAAPVALAAGALGASVARAGPAADYDVIVVGGGFAGVTAARECSRSGLRTLLVEAKSRLGGRTYTSSFAGKLVELGGTWIHWTQPYVWAEAMKYGLAVEETPGAAPERVVVRSAGKAVELDAVQWGGVSAAIESYFAEARTVLERPYDLRYRWEEVLRRDGMTSADRLAQIKMTELQRDAVAGLMETLANAPISQASYNENMRWYALPGWSMTAMFDSTGRYHLKDGTAALIDRINGDSKAEVRLGSPVTRIEQDSDGVTVVLFSGERLHARAAVLALPMNVLASIDYAPALPAGLVALSRERHSSVGMKLYVEVEGDMGRLMALAPSPSPIGLLMTYASMGNRTVLVGFGADAKALAFNDDEAVQRAVSMLLPGVRVLSSTSYGWHADPFAMGTYANFRPGAIARSYDATLLDHGRLVLGVGDFGEGWRGFIDGAIGAGFSASQRVARLLAGEHR